MCWKNTMATEPSGSIKKPPVLMGEPAKIAERAARSSVPRRFSFAARCVEALAVFSKLTNQSQRGRQLAEWTFVIVITWLCVCISSGKLGKGGRGEWWSGIFVYVWQWIFFLCVHKLSNSSSIFFSIFRCVSLKVHKIEIFLASILNFVLFLY